MDRPTNQSIEQLYRESFPAVARSLSRIGATMNQAKDIFHDALVVYLEKQQSNQLNIRTSAPAYLSGIARILWLKKYRNEKRFTSLDADGDALAVPDDFYSVEKEYPGSVLEHLQSAGQKCLELLQSLYYEQKSIQEVADRFGYKTKHSASVQKHKCIEKIRNILKTSARYEEAFK
jgi:DNA-directed RNA polymerase specialized sigma24 family protein